MPRDDSDAAQCVLAALQRDGVTVHLGSEVINVEQNGSQRCLSWNQADGRSATFLVDELLVATGRIPNYESLQLAAADIQFDERRGVLVDDHLCTSNARVYAAGDVCSTWRFTHAADFMARIAIQNALFFGRKRLSRLLIPRCTYTSPEVAHVGLTAAEAGERGAGVSVLERPFAEVDRAVIAGESEGFVKLYLKGKSDRILGATVVAADAGELITQLTLLIQHRIGLKSLASVIHPYPTRADILRNLGDQFQRTRLTPFVKTVLRGWLHWFC